jgi:uncharacterized protein (TIGR03083 family)
MNPISPLETIASLKNVWQSIAEVTADLTTEQWSRQTECPGWNVADQLVHLIGVERQVEGEVPPLGDVSDAEHVKNEFGAFNERWIRDRRPRGGAVIREEFLEVTNRRLAKLAALSPDDFESLVWSPMGERPMADLLSMRLFDSLAHETDIRRALDMPAPQDEVAQRVSLGRMALAVPGVLGRLGRLSEGEAVTLDLGLADSQAWSWVFQDGRVNRGPGVLRTAISLPADVALLRFCGRVGAQDTLVDPRVSITGDRDLGEAFLEAINVVP